MARAAWRDDLELRALVRAGSDWLVSLQLVDLEELSGSERVR
jgi:hypothetical protein